MGASGWYAELGVRDLGALAEERECGVLGSWWWVSWAGLVEVDGGEDSPLSLGSSPGSGLVLEHPFSRWPKEGVEQGGGIPDPSSLIPVPSTLPHLTKPSFSISHFTLITHSLCAELQKPLSPFSLL